VLRLVHISDLHFAEPTWSPLQFFSKRWLGNFHLLFSRQFDYLPERLVSLPNLWKSKRATGVVVSGDLTTTSRREEFERASSFVRSFSSTLPTVVVPGNHDQYTKTAHRGQWFYDYFPSEMKHHGVSMRELSSEWWLIAFDTAIATPLISSEGLFSETTEETLHNLLLTLPKNAKVIATSHYPFFPYLPKRKTLRRGHALEAFFRSHPQIRLYLHGHSHRHTIADLRADGLPIVLDSGSASSRKSGTWNLLEITNTSCTIEVFTWDQEWRSHRTVTIPL
jgi:3',5'-cyclic AMP phosphodiesterase CpdA